MLAEFAAPTLIVTFNRDVTLADASTSPWNIPGRTVTEVNQIDEARIAIDSTGLGSPLSMSYAPPPNAVIGDPDGAPVETFTNFPIEP